MEVQVPNYGGQSVMGQWWSITVPVSMLINVQNHEEANEKLLINPNDSKCIFTSGIPEPHAYGAKALTSVTARKAKSKAQQMYIR